jgi:predicted nucleotidyltransferase
MDISQIKSIVTSYFSNLPVSKVYLFGSYARGKANAASDIDILICPDKTLSLFTIGGYKSDLEKMTGKSVDVIPENSLDPLVKPYVQNDLMVVYER